MNQLIAAARLIRTIRFFGTGAAFVILGIGVVVSFMFSEIAAEIRYYRQFGPEWKEQYEARRGRGSLAEARAKLLVGSGSLPVIGGLSWLLYREIRGKHGGRRRSRRRR